jgi:phosphotransferase system  glucose/maltose/N-acetylglucosamine-specific IIC component
LLLAGDVVAVVIVVVVTVLVVVAVLGLNVWGAVQDGREERRRHGGG